MQMDCSHISMNADYYKQVLRTRKAKEATYARHCLLWKGLTDELKSLSTIVFQYHIKEGVKVLLPSQKMENKNKKKITIKKIKVSCVYS
ncbi:LOW QUALITY PROTEIN: hypothetical protein TorRG33x02_101560 [Trema orientale]|uniref:Uncharacterized protein n=1 Tax=Trema orientale TaxID=63057 RepID=A0A2P5F8L3_TREOI|nr:LOW QUALITY PROTEIN: hypothetical protein TorRG33x02_101560 [Trema orientale]